MTPEAKAIIDNATALDQKYNDIGQELAGANASLGVSQQTVQQMQAQLSTAAASVNAMQAQLDAARAAMVPLAKKVTSFPDLQKRIGWIQPGATGNVGAAGTVHGSYTQTVQPDGSALWHFTPKHKQGEPWDTFFLYLNLADFDDDVRHFYYPIQWRVPTPADYDANQQLETNWEVSTGAGRMNWGFAWSLAQKVWQWYKFATDANGTKGWKPVPGLPDVSAILRGGDPVLLEQEMRRVGTDALFEAVYINGVGFKVGMTNPIAPSNWKRYMQIAHQADAKGQDVPFSVITDIIRVDWI